MLLKCLNILYIYYCDIHSFSIRTSKIELSLKCSECYSLKCSFLFYNLKLGTLLVFSRKCCSFELQFQMSCSYKLCSYKKCVCIE